MCRDGSCFRKLFLLFVIFYMPKAWAEEVQGETPQETRYRDDYERLESIAAIKIPLRRAEQLLAFYGQRPDSDLKLRNYADQLFAQDLSAISKQENYVALRGIAERAIKLRPKFGEAYFYYATGLRQQGDLNEAMKAYAKCYVLANPLQKKAKELLDALYRTQNRGSVSGEEKLIKEAAQEVKE